MPSLSPIWKEVKQPSTLSLAGWRNSEAKGLYSQTFGRMKEMKQRVSRHVYTSRGENVCMGFCFLGRAAY